MGELDISDVQPTCRRFLGAGRGELGQAHGRARGVLRARGCRRRGGLLRDARRGGRRVDRQRCAGLGTAGHRVGRSAARVIGGSRSGERRDVAVARSPGHGLGCDLQPAQIRLGSARRGRPADHRRDSGRASNSGPLGPRVSRVRRVLDAPRRGGDDAAGGGGVRGGRVRASGQSRRGCPAAFPCGHGQPDPGRRTLDHAGRPCALRASEDGFGAVSRRAAGRADATSGGRVGAGGAGQAGGGDQGGAAGGVARSQPSSQGDPATDGRAR
jgi:hypothetical protein